MNFTNESRDAGRKTKKQETTRVDSEKLTKADNVAKIS